MYSDKRYRFTKTRNLVLTDEGETPDAAASPEPAKSDGDSCEPGILQKVRDFCSRFTEPDQKKECEENKAKDMCNNKEALNPCEEDPAFLKNPFFNFLRQMRKDNSGLSVVEIARQGGSQWNSMSYEEKMPFFAMAYWARKCNRTKSRERKGCGHPKLNKNSSKCGKKIKKKNRSRSRSKCKGKSKGKSRSRSRSSSQSSNSNSPCNYYS